MWPTREQKTIISLLRCSLGYETPGVSDEVLSGNLDWDAIRKLAFYHGISHLLLNAIKKDGMIKVPSSVIDAFEKEYLYNCLMHMLYEGALKEIVHHFNGEGIRFVVHKGLGLSSLLYEEPELRPCGGDLDILIPIKDYPATKAGLEKIGYSLPHSDYEIHEIAFIGEVKFVKDIGGRQVAVDLHTDLIANHWGKVTRFKIDDFWDRLLEVKYNDFFIPYLPLEVYLFFLCIHCAANHIFDRLITLCDLSLFVRKYIQKIDWDYVEKFAKENGAMKVLYHPLNFCRRLLKTPLPEYFLDSIKPGYFSRFIVPERHLLLRDREPPKSLERYMHLVLLDNPFHALRSVIIFLKRLFGECAIRRKTGSALE
jgi:hypothetical protein